jgi:hypothetical protein
MDKPKSKDILLQILKDMDDFATMKGLDYPPIYLLGGSGCIIAGYLNRATTDIDLLDMDYDSTFGRLLRILDKYDYLDMYLTTIPIDFKARANKISDFKNIFVLSKQDIILSKIGRYSKVDIEDITELMVGVDKKYLLELISSVISRENLSARVKDAFLSNLILFKEQFNV